MTKSRYSPSVLVDDLSADAPLDEKIIAMRQAGLSAPAIARRLGLAAADVHGVVSAWSSNYFSATRRADMVSVPSSLVARGRGG